jgi:signal transduction histidine kinase/CheY-like chemotaxis protein
MPPFQIDPMLSKVAENISLAWAYLDADLHYRKVSWRYAKTFNLTEGDIENKPLLEVVGERAYGQLSPYIERVLNGEEVRLDKNIELDHNQGTFYRRATYLPQKNGDKVEGFYVFMNDQTESSKTINTLRRLHMITADNSYDVDYKIQRILALGKQTFDLPIALVSQIQGDIYCVEYADTPNGEVSPGAEFELGKTYCVHALNADGPIGFDYVGKSQIRTHPCYQAFGLETYIGIPLIVSGKRYGTLNFSSPEPHAHPFTEQDFELIRLFAQWIGNELGNKIVSESLNRQKTLLDSMSQQARIGAWEVDLVNSQIYWSPMTKEIHEVDEDFEPDLATAINFYKEGYSRDQITTLVNRAIEEGLPWHEELQLVTAKGNEIWVAARGQAEFKGQECVRLYGSFQDIDEKVKSDLELKEAKERAEEAARSKSAFLANMSHEIRTPMNGVLGMLNLLSSADLSEDVSKKISVAEKSAGSLLSLLDDILDFSKVDAGCLALDETVFNLNGLFYSFAESVRFDVEAKKLQLKLNFEGFEQQWVKADAGRIRQVLYNLVGNAIKFTSKGIIEINAKLITNGEQCVLRCSVVDTGIGIPEEKQKILFDPFTQADSSTTRKFGGTGLGLAISKQLCELMNGGIWIESEPGKGSTFRFILKFSSADEPSSESIVPEKEHSQLSKRDAKILLVEDNLINQLVATEMLSHLGHEVDVAENGLEALRVLNDDDVQYDLILMDCQMPEMDGYEATNRVRKGEAGDRYKKVPIVALTANAMKGDRESCLDAGMSDYLSKPVSAEALDEVLSRHLSQ